MLETQFQPPGTRSVRPATRSVNVNSKRLTLTFGTHVEWDVNHRLGEIVDEIRGRVRENEHLDLQASRIASKNRIWLSCRFELREVGLLGVESHESCLLSKV